MNESKETTIYPVPVWLGATCLGVLIGAAVLIQHFLDPLIGPSMAILTSVVVIWPILQFISRLPIRLAPPRPTPRRRLG